MGFGSGLDLRRRGTQVFYLCMDLSLRLCGEILYRYGFCELCVSAVDVLS
jgi:hypothetical protein